MKKKGILEARWKAVIKNCYGRRNPINATSRSLRCKSVVNVKVTAVPNTHRGGGACNNINDT